MTGELGEQEPLPVALADLLRREAENLVIDLDADQIDAFGRLASSLRIWNRRLNLTRVVEPEHVVRRHFLDSLACLVPVAALAVPGSRWVDVGSGAGFPGLPLAIASPFISVVLVEATKKKVEFLQHMVAAVALRNVEVVWGRAEEVARLARYREEFDVAVARALAPLVVALEWCLPLVRVGGAVVLPRGPVEADALESGRRAANALGARLRPPIVVERASRPRGRMLVVADKVDVTPERFPRRAAATLKRPLGRFSTTSERPSDAVDHVTIE